MTSNNSICSYDVKNNLREMMAGLYDSDHDFYEQLKKAIYYDGKTYIGVCERLIELIGSGCCHGKVDVNAGREAAADWVDDFRDEVAAMVGIACNGMVDDVQDAIKDELDKRLMPDGMEWPMFDDGEKVQYGDIYIFNGHACPIDTIRIENNGAFSIEAGKRIAYFARNGTVKRPEQPVMASDGKPIKVGDTVYLTGTSYLFEVRAVRKGAAKNEFGEWYDAGLLTHTQPDTQKSIDEDARVNSYDYCKKRGLDLTNYTVASKRDLLRRQRELCAKGGE